MGSLEYVFCNHFGGGVYLKNGIEWSKRKNSAATRSWPVSPSRRAPNPKNATTLALDRIPLQRPAFIRGKRPQDLIKGVYFTTLDCRGGRNKFDDVWGSITSRLACAFKGVTASGRDCFSFAPLAQGGSSRFRKGRFGLSPLPVPLLFPWVPYIGIL